jgi:hypothetical protein
VEFAEDVGELFGLGINVNEFDPVNDPVAAGKDAATRGKPGFGHLKGCFETLG